MPLRTSRLSPLLQRTVAPGMATQAGEDQERGDRHHVQLLGRFRSSPPGAHAQGQQRRSAATEVLGESAQGIQRTEDGERRSPDVRERGPHHPAPLHVLRLHRDEGARQERAALQLRRAR